MNKVCKQTMPEATRKLELDCICSEFSIGILYAFGSREQEAAAWLQGNIQCMQASSSDLDLGVLPYATRLSARDKVELTLRLEDFFQVSRVDLIVLPEAPPFLASRIIQGQRLYAWDQDQADEYDLYVLRRAGDLLPFHRERLELLFGEAK